MRELTLPAPLVLLPGLAADARLFARQRRALGPGLITPEWPALPPEPGRRETLRNFAKRWAGALHLNHVRDMDPAKPWVLGGASMGGMVALEMLPHLPRKPAAVLLVGSAVGGGAVSRPAQLGAALAGWVGRPGVLRMVMRGLLLPSTFYDGQDDDGRRLLGQMATDADPARLQWGVGACVDWPGPSEAAQEVIADGVPVRHLRGGADRIIHPVTAAPERTPPGATEETVIEDAGHFLSLSHRQTVNRWLFDQVMRTCGIDESGEPRVEDPDRSWARRPEEAARF